MTGVAELTRKVEHVVVGVVGVAARPVDWMHQDISAPFFGVGIGAKRRRLMLQSFRIRNNGRNASSRAAPTHRPALVAKKTANAAEPSKLLRYRECDARVHAPHTTLRLLVLLYLQNKRGYCS